MENYSEVRAILERLCGAKGVSGAEDGAANAAAEMLAEYMPFTGARSAASAALLRQRSSYPARRSYRPDSLVVTAIDDDASSR